jgi:hypothetical protein
MYSLKELCESQFPSSLGRTLTSPQPRQRKSSHAYALPSQRQPTRGSKKSPPPPFPRFTAPSLLPLSTALGNPPLAFLREISQTTENQPSPTGKLLGNQWEMVGNPGKYRKFSHPHPLGNPFLSHILPPRSRSSCEFFKNIGQSGSDAYSQPFKGGSEVGPGRSRVGPRRVRMSPTRFQVSPPRVRITPRRITSGLCCGAGGVSRRAYET